MTTSNEAYEKLKKQAMGNQFYIPESHVVLHEYANLPTYMRRYCAIMEEKR